MMPNFLYSHDAPRVRPLGSGALIGFALLLVVLGAAVAKPLHACGLTEPDPLALYGEELKFVVERNGRNVGAHVTRFARAGERLEVVSEMQIEIDFLIFTAYRFAYRSTDVWCGNRLESLQAFRDDNGEKQFVQAERAGDQVLVSDGQRDLRAPANIMPTNHWNAAVLSRDRVLNTLTGDIDRVQIEPLGPASITRADGQTLEAQHYRYTGEIEADVWYDADGRWVGLRFEGKDGSEIVYRCERCGTLRFTGSNNASRPATPDDRRPG